MKLRKNKYKNIIKEATKFRPYDYRYLLNLEEKSLIYMRDYFSTSGLAIGNGRRAELISLAIKLLRITNCKDASLKFPSHPLDEYQVNRYVNTKNAKRYCPYFKKFGPFELHSLRIEKAWKLYCRIREQYLRSW